MDESIESRFPFRGPHLLHESRWNHGTGFTAEERDALGLHGLLPPAVLSIERHMARVLENLGHKSDDLERYIALISLQDRNETLFYRLLIEHLPRIMPLIYTPTVGEACQKFGHIFRRPRGLYLTARDKGRMAEVVANWPHEAKLIVVTDGERILGLGDLGADGIGIPIGKLSLYTAAAGIEPTSCLPVMFDVGTDDARRLQDPLYLGLRVRRVRGTAYDELFAEMIAALVARFPDAVIQMEDFAKPNAFRLLRDYRDRVCLFNDDIQGTGAVVAAGLLSALRIVGRSITDTRLLFVGAGEATIGTADTLVALLQARGLSQAEARSRCWFIDSRGLVVAGRDGLDAEKQRFAHEHAPVSNLVNAIEAIQPHALIGASGQTGIFTSDAIGAMARMHARPVVFALSNPTWKAECTAEQAYGWSDGRAVFASGSPFDTVEIEGRRVVPGQANNAYIFPGVGLGLIAARATRARQAIFQAAAEALAELVTDQDLEQGRVYPALEQIRSVSAHVAEAVARASLEAGVARIGDGEDLGARVRELMWFPSYQGPASHDARA